MLLLSRPERVTSAEVVQAVEDFGCKRRGIKGLGLWKMRLEVGVENVGVLGSEVISPRSEVCLRLLVAPRVHAPQSYTL